MADNKKMDDSLFEDVPYGQAPAAQAEGGMDDSLFEDTLHPELQAPRDLATIAQEQAAQEQEGRPDVSAGRSALIGAGQGATFGFGEEITAPFVAGVGMFDDSIPTLQNESTLEKFQRLMQTYRDVARNEQKAAQEQHQDAYLAGNVVGGLATPGLGAVKAMKAVKDAGTIAKVGTGAAVGAGFGGLTGLGEAEGSLEERLPEAIETAKSGAVVGAAIPVAGAALSTTGKALSKVGELPFLSKIGESFKRGAAGENLVTEGGRRKAADAIREKGGELYNDIKALQDDIGSQISDKIDEAESAGAQINLTDDVNEVLKRLKTIQAEGSEEAAAYARSIESEIKKVLKIKPDKVDELSKLDAPEGLILPKTQETVQKEVIATPKQAQDLKQVLQGYGPKKGMAPQQLEGAQTARQLSSTAGDKLNDVTGIATAAEEGALSLNQQYGTIKDTLKRLTVNEKKLPEQIKEKINNIVSRLGDEGTPGDNARQLIDDVIADLNKVSPEIAAKYSDELNNMAGRLKLGREITKGMQSGLGLGTLQSFGKAAANVAGLAANKTGMVGPTKAVTNFTKAVLTSPTVQKAGVIGETQNKLSSEPYKLQRQVASAAETADPEILKEQAQNIRNQYGTQGEQLATILENMSTQNKDSRRALMFTVMQNQAYRKMLGMNGEE